MLTEYLDAAMRRAIYDQMEDGSWFGEIPGFPGLWASAPTHDACARELRSTLEDWILLRVHFHDPLPEIDGINLVADGVA